MNLDITRTITIPLSCEAVFSALYRILPPALRQIGEDTEVTEMPPDDSGLPRGYTVTTPQGSLRYIVGQRRVAEFLSMDSLHLHHRTGISFRCEETDGVTSLTIVVFFHGRGDEPAVEASLRSLSDKLVQCLEADICPPPAPVPRRRPRRKTQKQK